jgi:hypothetical protein
MILLSGAQYIIIGVLKEDNNASKGGGGVYIKITQIGTLRGEGGGSKMVQKLNIRII